MLVWVWEVAPLSIQQLQRVHLQPAPDLPRPFPSDRPTPPEALGRNQHRFPLLVDHPMFKPIEKVIERFTVIT